MPPRRTPTTDRPDSLAGIGSLFVYETLKELQRGQRALLAGVHELTDLVVDFIEHQASDETDKEELKRQLRVRLDRLKALGVIPPTTT